MPFLIYALDEPGHGDVRQAKRSARLAYLGRAGPRVKIAGPLLAEGGETMAGSVVVIEAEDRGAAGAFADADPYARAKLFESLSVKPWRWDLGNPERRCSA